MVKRKYRSVWVYDSLSLPMKDRVLKEVVSLDEDVSYNEFNAHEQVAIMREKGTSKKLKTNSFHTIYNRTIDDDDMVWEFPILTTHTQ